jgi:hypothetical protein
MGVAAISRSSAHSAGAWLRAEESEATMYQARQFPLSALKGISDKTLEMHFKLYEGIRE